MVTDHPTSSLCVIVENTIPPTLTVSGEADFHNREDIYDAVRKLIDGGHSPVRADLTDLRYMDSSALATLVKCAIEVHEAGGALELMGASRQVARVLNQCGAAVFFRSRVQDVPVDGLESGGRCTQGFWRVANFSLPARPDAAAIARQRLADIVHVLPLSSSEGADVIIAFGEAVANAIRHGCGGDPQHRIRVRCVAGPSRLAIDVSDPGPGFSPARIPDPSSRSIIDGGMGIYIMRELMDEVEFFFGEGTTARLVKHIAAVRDACRK